jgi:predicted RND superfamily exporter protein
MKKNYLKIYLEVITVVGLLALLTFSLNLYFEFLDDYMSGFMMSFGLSLTVLSVILKNNKKFQQMQELTEKDERLKMIKEKQLSATYFFHIVFTVVLVIIFGFFDETKVLSVGLASMLMLEWVYLMVMGYYYHKVY